jgi:hypothetical protein
MFRWLFAAPGATGSAGSVLIDSVSWVRPKQVRWLGAASAGRSQHPL